MGDKVGIHIYLLSHVYIFSCEGQEIRQEASCVKYHTEQAVSTP